MSSDNFDLQATNGTLLSQILEDLRSPQPTKKETPEVTPSTSKKQIKIENVAEVETPIGKYFLHSNCE